MSHQSLTNRITSDAITTVALWGEHHNTKIALADIPTNLKKYNIINSNHLLEMEEILKQVTLKAYEEDINMFDACLSEAPELILHHTDEYMASLVHNLSRKY